MTKTGFALGHELGPNGTLDIGILVIIWNLGFGVWNLIRLFEALINTKLNKIETLKI